MPEKPKRQIDLLGRFEFRDGPSLRPVPTRSYLRLYALLALAPEAGSQRHRLAESAFPEVDSAVANNRLRVALATLRKEFPDLIWTEGDRIGLRLESVEIDVVQATDRIRSLRFELDEETEFVALKELGETLAKTILPNLPDDWVVEAREKWSSIAIGALERGIELARHFFGFRSSDAIHSSGIRSQPVQRDDMAVVLSIMPAERGAPASGRTLRTDATDVSARV